MNMTSCLTRGACVPRTVHVTGTLDDPDAALTLNGIPVPHPGGRFSARVQSARGESAKEYIVANGALILDDDVFHQYFFLARRAPVGSVPVVVPRRSTQLTMRVEPLGGERVTVGGRALEARRFRLTEPGGAVRELWTDDAGRVLRVEIPSRGVVAVRDDPPA